MTGEQKSPNTFEMSLDKVLKDNKITEWELADLRTTIGCESDGERVKLSLLLEKKILEKTEITEETKKQLRDFLKDCISSIETKETKESREMFDRVFEETKSEMLSKERIQGLKVYILSKFERFGLDTIQKDNLATAVIDRLLSDKAFSGIVGDLSGKVTNVVDVLSKLTGDDKKEAPDSEDITKKKVETSMTGLAKRIGEIIDSATKPLVELLDTKPAPSGLKGFLSNPEEISKYD